MNKLSIAGAALALSMATVGLAPGANAAVLYDNGPINAGVNAWTIDFIFAVSDSFTLAQASTVTGVNFGVWAFPGDTMASVDWAITTTPGTYPVDGSAAVGTSFLYTNGFGYDISLDSFSTGGVSLAAGTYYLVLQNAVTTNGDPISWDENDGPSSATENTVGAIGSESFQILGTTGGVPEPATWALMLVGLGGLGATLRSRRFKSAQTA